MAGSSPSGGGYDIGASLSGSSSSGASQSGATDQSGGGNYGGTNYGPGSLILTDQKGSIGASALAGTNLLPWLIGAAVGVGAILILKKL